MGLMANLYLQHQLQGMCQFMEPTAKFFLLFKHRLHRHRRSQNLSHRQSQNLSQLHLQRQLQGEVSQAGAMLGLR